MLYYEWDNRAAVGDMHISYISSQWISLKNTVERYKYLEFPDGVSRAPTQAQHPSEHLAMCGCSGRTPTRLGLPQDLKDTNALCQENSLL